MAMPNVVKMFPRGYSGGEASSQPANYTREGDPEINQLYDKYCQGNSHSGSWSFRRQVLAAAKRLLNGHTNWFIRQDANPMVMAYTYEFLLDTLRFVATGRRRISIHCWPDLLSHNPEDGLTRISERQQIAEAFVDLALSTSVDAVLQRWCGQPKGFDDLMVTLHLLFGEVNLKAVPQV